MGYNLQNYEEVKDRILRAKKDLEKYRMETKLLSDPCDISTVVIQAFLYNGDILLATGLASEWKGTGANQTSWLENCETSAVGRALANYGYSGNLRPSREEMKKVQKHEQEQQPITNEAQPQSLQTPRNKELQECIAKFVDNKLITIAIINDYVKQKGKLIFKELTDAEAEDVAIRVDEFIEWKNKDINNANPVEGGSNE